MAYDLSLRVWRGDKSGGGFGDYVVDVEEGDTTARLFGVSLDLGTTTVVATLLDLKSGAAVIHSDSLYGMFCTSAKYFGIQLTKNDQPKLPQR